MDNANKAASNNTNETASKSSHKRGRLLTSIIIAALFLIGIIQALTGSKGYVTTEINDQYLGVAGTFGNPVFLSLNTITDVQLLDPFDFGTCVDGEETGNTVSGTYSCDEYGTYTVHAYTDELCIVVQSSNGVLVFNCGSNSHTKKMYAQLAEVTAKN